MKLKNTISFWCVFRRRKFLLKPYLLRRRSSCAIFSETNFRGNSERAGDPRRIRNFRRSREILPPPGLFRIQGYRWPPQNFPLDIPGTTALFDSARRRVYPSCLHARTFAIVRLYVIKLTFSDFNPANLVLLALRKNPCRQSRIWMIIFTYLPVQNLEM